MYILMWYLIVNMFHCTNNYRSLSTSGAMIVRFGPILHHVTRLDPAHSSSLTLHLYASLLNLLRTARHNRGILCVCPAEYTLHCHSCTMRTARECGAEAPDGTSALPLRDSTEPSPVPQPRIQSQGMSLPPSLPPSILSSAISSLRLWSHTYWQRWWVEFLTGLHGYRYLEITPLYQC